MVTGLPEDEPLPLPGEPDEPCEALVRVVTGLLLEPDELGAEELAIDPPDTLCEPLARVVTAPEEAA